MNRFKQFFSKNIFLKIFLLFLLLFLSTNMYIIYKYYDRYIDIEKQKKLYDKLKIKNSNLKKILSKYKNKDIKGNSDIKNKFLQINRDKKIVTSIYIRNVIIDKKRKKIYYYIDIRYNSEIISSPTLLIGFLALLYSINGVEKIIDVDRNSISLIYSKKI